ncbi:DeoR/GlpR family DNA-binding transcription regulator [Virgibacillus dakarensis]|uniref:DeoR/GlpR family DNA-binding transcription regulator n=1 Tax=Virgibacillus dakarensis TaxID=1917889 RepID=UPI000B44D85E|nr:DeoR/GlpR family DNA-binding transcription regulator [Virgibacillus dakarensis]
MLILDRQNKVLQYVKNKRVATVTELANHFEVHEATIRRDLSLLEKEGKLKRTHGGVMIDDEIHSEPPFNERESAQYEEKRKIGQLAAELIEDGHHIILDSGTTTAHIADAITEKQNLTVITNDINIAAKLRFSLSIKVIVTGGMLFPESYILNGMITDEVLDKLHVHIAFIGTPAFHPTLGLTHFDETLVPAKRAMIRSAKKTVVVCDHTKIGRVSLHTVAKNKDIDSLITSQLSEENITSLTDNGIDVRLV